MKKMSEKLIPKCRCGGVAELAYRPNVGEYVICGYCCTRSGYYGTEDEAIQTWNTAMGERTAKAKDLDRRSETSISWEGTCTECGSYTMHDMNYCFHCGARLEWDGSGEWHCSECGDDVLTEGSWEYPETKGYNFCPHCGCKMG